MGLSVAAGAAFAQNAPVFKTKEGDFTVRDFRFQSGETLPELRLHYTTLGTPRRDAAGHVTNAVLILHGTGGDGHQFLRPQFADVLFVPGGLLDPARYYIILPDDIGHGKSSKPSDGLRMRFPHYDYDDMVTAEHALVTQGLGVDHLRIVMGTSMGCMHSFIWGEAYPDFVDGLMPLACLPIEIAGRNRIWRKMLIDGIENDPAWDNGDYKTEPKMGLRVAIDMLVMAGSAPVLMQKEYPTRAAADKFLADFTAKELAGLDADDLLYQVDSSRNYDPSSKLGAIKAHVMWVNSADDFINPPELGIAQTEVKKIKHGRFVLIPISDKTHGHSTHTWAAVWQNDLAELLRETAKSGR
ncbi:MAG: alpha/beta fold hydrolase [Alphaproteobacteria bacterium]|nr:alpha/beta fold hydrolase [Alphaproteobacteria bacterium]MDE2265161.1 alpha/beta fold hydrolase [Alphaproteobacteria bacterium]MDE2499401.1 alpha/beta fold hydrolase [Alphaproteobacteria bacterium]